MYEALEALLIIIIGIFEQICLGILKTAKKVFLQKFLHLRVCLYVHILVLGCEVISTESLDPKQCVNGLEDQSD